MNYLPHLMVLIVCCVTLWILKRKYKKIRNIELVVVFVLFVLLIAIFTEHGMGLIKHLINLIQVD
jgi:K+-sensing histidine kinase KdpD